VPPWNSGIALETNPFQNFKADIVAVKASLYCDVVLATPGVAACSTGISWAETINRSGREHARHSVPTRATLKLPFMGVAFHCPCRANAAALETGRRGRRHVYRDLDLLLRGRCERRRSARFLSAR
jgi:hypothetical protein